MMEYKIASKTAKENSLGVKSASRSQEPKSIAITKLKGTVQRDFGPPTFFHHSNLPGPLTNSLKHFSILVLFSPRHLYFSESPRGIIPQRVNLSGVSYPGESSDFSGS